MRITRIELEYFISNIAMPIKKLTWIIKSCVILDDQWHVWIF